MVFVWSDDLARLLLEEKAASLAQVTHWIISPTAYRLPDDGEPLVFAHELLDAEAGHSDGGAATSHRRRAS